MKLLVLLLIFTLSYADLIRISSQDGVIDTSVKLDLYTDFPHKVYIISWQEYSILSRTNQINKMLLYYSYRF